MEITEFTHQFPLRTFQEGEVLISEGEALATLLILDTGFVKVMSIDDSGVEHLLWIATHNDIIPSEHLFSEHSEVQFFYTALTNGNAYNIHKPTFLNYVSSHAESMASIAERMSKLSDILLQRINATSQQTVRGKLITTLYYLSERFGKAASPLDLHAIGLPLTHLDIAEMIGATRETTSIELKRLRHDGYIDYSRSSFIVKHDKLKNLFG